MNTREYHGNGVYLGSTAADWVFTRRNKNAFTLQQTRIMYILGYIRANYVHNVTVREID